MPRSQDKGGAEASARHTRSRWKRLRHTTRHGNDVFWYEHGNVFFSVKPLLFLQLERSRLQLVVCNGFLKKNQHVQQDVTRLQLRKATSGILRYWAFSFAKMLK